MVSLGWIRIINRALLPVKNECDTSIVLLRGLLSEMSQTLGVDDSTRLFPESSGDILSNLYWKPWGPWMNMIYVWTLCYLCYISYLISCTKCEVLALCVSCTYVTALSVFSYNNLNKTNWPTVHLFYLSLLTNEWMDLLKCGHPFTLILADISLLLIPVWLSGQPLYEPAACFKCSRKKR